MTLEMNNRNAVIKETDISFRDERIKTAEENINQGGLNQC